MDTFFNSTTMLSKRLIATLGKKKKGKNKHFTQQTKEKYVFRYALSMLPNGNQP